MTRILVTGSRDWHDIEFLDDVIRLMAEAYPGATFVHGACQGADTLAAEMWRKLGYPVEAHPAEWHRYGRSAGPRRNQYMVDLGADVCLAFIRNGSKGASGCARMAKAAGIETLVYEVHD